MPKITIREIDSTTPLGLDRDEYIVFIPGNVGGTNAKDSKGNTFAFKGAFDKPTLISNIRQFIDFAGDTIPTYEGDATTPYTIATTSGQTTIYTVYDPGYMIARKSLEKGLKVYYYVPSKNDSKITVWSDIVDAIETLEDNTITYKCKVFKGLEDKRKYNLRFITNGGYSLVTKNNVPNSIKAIMYLANVRGDCTFLADHDFNVTTNEDVLLCAKGVSDCLSTLANYKDGKYGAMFTPQCTYANVSGDVEINIDLPASVAYLDAFGTSVINYPPYYAMAGRLRGNISGTPTRELGDLDVEVLSVEENGVAVNPITKVDPYGILVWGNRTLFKNGDGLVASSFLNIRQLCSELSKTLYSQSLAYMFEQNSDRLWINFKSKISEVLDGMKTNLGIKGYKIIKLTPDTRAQIKALVKVVAVEAVEKFDLTIELVDNDVVLELV